MRNPDRPLAILLALALLGAGCSAGERPAVSSRSYRGHAGDGDVTNFVTVYRGAVGSRLDDCQTCHRGGAFTEADGGGTVTKNPCDYCHLIQNPAPGYVEPMPADYRATLNAYGLAYLDGGRSASTLRAIDSLDSDGDGATNGAEIAALRYPGDPSSRPGQPSAPTRTFTMAQVRALPSHAQFVLANASRQANDYYAGYRGVRIRDLLIAAGVDPDSAGFEGVTVVAPDGYLRDVSAREINASFPRAVFFGGLDSATLGAECGFVRYPSPLPAGVVDRARIPGEPWLLLAYERDGQALDPSALDITSGKIAGEGPFRLVVPQSAPSAPDRGAAAPPTRCAAGRGFDPAADHNAGGFEWSLRGGPHVQFYGGTGAEAESLTAAGDAYEREDDYFITCALEGRPVERCKPASTRTSIVLAWLERRAIETGKVIQVNERLREAWTE